MSKWTTLVLAVILLGLLAVAMFVATPGGSGVAVPPKLVEFSPSSVKSLVVNNGTGEVHLERDAKDRERWRLRVGTNSVRANSMEVEEILNDLSRLAPTNIYTEAEIGPGERKKWGLDPAGIRVAIGLEASTVTVEFGARVSHNAWACKSGQPEVYLVPKTAMDRLEKLQGVEIREKSPLGWSAHEARSLALKRRDGLELEARRTSAAIWEVTRPFTGPAEPTAMERLLAALLGVRATEFLSDGAPDLEKHDLLDPLAVVTVRREGRDTPSTIRISKPGEDGRCRFLEDGEPTVYAGGEDLAKAVIALDPAKLRDRNLLRLGWAKVDAVEFIHPEKPWKLLRVLERWDLEKPERCPAEGSEVETLLKALRETEATAFLDGEDPAAHGLATAEGAAARLELRGTDESGTRTLLLGKRREDGTVEARVVPPAGSKDVTPVVTVPDSFVDLLESGWLQWRTREVLEAPLAEIRGLSWKSGGVEHSFLRENNAWKAAPGSPEPDSEALTAAMTQLLHLDCVGYEASTKEGLEKWGLGEPPAGPVITITLRREGEAEARTRSLVLGSEPEGGGSRYARMADGDLVFRIPSHLVSGSNVVPLVETLMKPGPRPPK